MAGPGDHPCRRAGLSALEAVIRLLVGAALAATACAAPLHQPPTTAPTAPVSLAVITWNLHRGVGDLPRLVADLAGGRLTPTPPRDYVLLLQEAVTNVPADPVRIARERQLAVVYEPVVATAVRVTGNAILSTRPLTGTRIIALPRVRQPRLAVAATITVADVELFLVNVHLENRVSLWRGLLFSDGPRGHQATTLLAQLPEGPGIAGGDLNTWLGPAEPAWKAFSARFPDTPNEPLEPTVRDRLVLDHLFFDVPDGWQVERRVLPDTYGSDHHPVIGVIRTP
jgi:endonuclease/exonuclease/phosphatase family metal-dependent hydrolase